MMPPKQSPTPLKTKIPASVTTYTPATVDPQLRSDVNRLLIRDGAVNKIHEALLHALNSHPSNWTKAVQEHALSLLRSGEANTFPTLIGQVLESIRLDAQQATGGGGKKSGEALNSGGAAANGKGKGMNGAAAAAAANPATVDGSLALPSVVVESALKVTRDCLESYVEITAPPE